MLDEKLSGEVTSLTALLQQRSMEQEPQQESDWTNFETWAILSWLNDDEESRKRWAMTARGCFAEAPTCEKFKSKVWTREEAETYSLSDLLEAEFRFRCPLPEDSPYRLLLITAMGYVNWDEVADHLLSNARKQSDE